MAMIPIPSTKLGCELMRSKKSVVKRYTIQKGPIAANEMEVMVIDFTSCNLYFIMFKLIA